MAAPLYTPRINNNDDTVRVGDRFVEPGARVRAGDPIIDVETDKATFTIEAEREEYVLGFTAQKGDVVAIGSVLAWMGANAEEAIPQETNPAAGMAETQETGVSLKAALLLARYGLDASRIAPANGQRLSEAEVKQYIASQGLKPAGGSVQTVAAIKKPGASGKAVALTPEQRGMLRTIEWHRTEAVAAYAEIAYDEALWVEHAAQFQKAQRLLMSPMLALVAWRLVEIAQERPHLNATISGGERYVYDHVNLGFTVQVGERLYVVVVKEAEKLGAVAFVKRLSELQRRAMKGELRADEVSDATIGFSSMARWQVTRHIPILLPHTALVVAHTAVRDGSGTLGATYDHRVLSGGDTVLALQALAQPRVAETEEIGR